MKLIRKLNMDLRKSLVIIWLTTCLSFLFTLNPNSPGASFSDFLTNLFLVNILIGIIAFIGIFLKPILKRFEGNWIIPYTPKIAIAYFIFYIAALTISGNGFIAGMSKRSEVVESTITPTPIATLTPIPTYTPTQIPKSRPVYVDPDPVVNCNIHPTCGGGVIKMNKSQCEQSTCCRVGDTWSVFPNNTACTQAQNSYRNTRTYIYPTFPPLGINATYPTVAPYQYSKEYLDSLNQFNQTVNQSGQPSQFVAPTSTCYATWQDYFNAHPNYAPQNIEGMSGTPPCD